MFSEENLHNYGSPLPILELDQVPSKKPLYVQDQIATDEQGRRRFHGAFTGGFSAGYWNTVGSKEGWTPQSFKSSRTEKTTEKLTQRPEDFMDDEDRGEFGIAPRSIKINEDFTSVGNQTEVRKRKFMQSDILQPIPGEPVLHQLVKPIRDKAAVRILKTWGWRPGQGIGPRQTKKEKKKARERNKKELYLMEKYGCEIPSTSNKNVLHSDDDEDYTEDEEEDEITFAPEDCELPPHFIKQDKYGIGYEPLSRRSVLGGSSTAKQTEHINLFQSLEAVGKQNQKISFTGQAFGVGAFEEDDDDVYAMDDMTRYDYSLEDKKKKKTRKKFDGVEDLLFGLFVLDRNPPKLPAYKVEIPFGWHPRNWNEKRSRFEPLDPRKQRNLEKIFPSSNDTEMTRSKRAELLGEELQKLPPVVEKEKPREIRTKTVEELQKEYKERKEKTKSLIEKITAKSSSFTNGGIISIDGEETPVNQENNSSSFKPFASNESKQQRYEKFLAKDFNTEQEIEEFLKTIQPIELSLWDRQMELKEFQQAKKLYKPLKGIMSDRFITESEIKAAEIENKKEEQKQIVVERSKQMWKPHSLLCKRYNIAEPFKGLLEDDKKSKLKQKKLTVFDYLETSVNKKADFQTPVVIPKNIDHQQKLVQQTSGAPKENENEKSATALEWQEVLNPSVKATKENKSLAFKPKTELEKQVIESINKPVAEKKDIFKAIFSESESEDEKEENKNEQVANEINKTLNATAVNLLRNTSPPRGIFKALFTASTAKTDDELLAEKQAVTHKDSNLLAKETTKVIFKPKSDREQRQTNTDVYGPALPQSLSSTGSQLEKNPSKSADREQKQANTDVYGPALPQSLSSTGSQFEKNPNKSALDDKILDLFSKHQSSEKWIEKTIGMDSTDTGDSSDTEDTDTSSSLKSVKQKKKSKKSKKKKLSEHKHKKHKERDNKSNKKSKKRDKKKKKHKKK